MMSSPSRTNRDTGKAAEHGDNFGEVAVENGAVAAAKLNPILQAEHQAPEAIPFRLKLPTALLWDGGD